MPKCDWLVEQARLTVLLPFLFFSLLSSLFSNNRIDPAWIQRGMTDLKHFSGTAKVLNKPEFKWKMHSHFHFITFTFLISPVTITKEPPRFTILLLFLVLSIYFSISIQHFIRNLWCRKSVVYPLGSEFQLFWFCEMCFLLKANAWVHSSKMTKDLWPNAPVVTNNKFLS